MLASSPFKPNCISCHLKPVAFGLTRMARTSCGFQSLAKLSLWC